MPETCGEPVKCWDYVTRHCGLPKGHKEGCNPFATPAVEVKPKARHIVEGWPRSHSVMAPINRPMEFMLYVFGLPATFNSQGLRDPRWKEDIDGWRAEQERKRRMMDNYYRDLMTRWLEKPFVRIQSSEE